VGGVDVDAPEEDGLLVPQAVRDKEMQNKQRLRELRRKEGLRGRKMVQNECTEKITPMTGRKASFPCAAIGE